MVKFEFLDLYYCFFYDEVREARSSAAPFRGGGGRGRSSRGRGGPGPNREFGNGNVEGFGGSYGGGGGRQDGEAGKGGNTRGDRGSYGAPYQSYGGGGYRQHNKDGENASDERPMRRQFERKSGTGRGNEFKREGSGRGNWGTAADDVNTELSLFNVHSICFSVLGSLECHHCV